MKKSIVLLGAFALLFAAPSFAQEETSKAPQPVKAEIVKQEKIEVKEAAPLEKEAIKIEEVKKEVVKPIQVTTKAEIKALEPKHTEEEK